MNSVLSRRSLLKGFGALSLGAGVSSLIGLSSQVALAGSSDYRALVIVYLGGGFDGNDILIPTDGAYLDYSKARPDLAIAKDSLTTLSGSSAGHTFGFSPMVKELAPLYEQGRLSMIANVGALIKPITAQQVLNRTAVIPPFLFSHSEQTSYIQGWMGDAEVSGWVGRSMEVLPPTLKEKLPVISYLGDFTILLGQQSRVTQTNANWGSYWGAADLSKPTDTMTTVIESLGLMQSKNVFEAEYGRTLGATFRDAVALSVLSKKFNLPKNNFPGGDLSDSLRHIAGMLPVFQAAGIKRQVFLVGMNEFDTHTNQRGTGQFSMDTKMSEASKCMAAFDVAVQASGLDNSVVSLAMTEFGRALQPASGGGTDHAWGNHWWLMGAPVKGKQVVGTFPSLTLGGPDDGDPWKKGRWVPTTAGDQVGATLMQWLGLPTAQITVGFPNLVNFSQKTLPLLHS